MGAVCSLLRRHGSNARGTGDDPNGEDDLIARMKAAEKSLAAKKKEEPSFELSGKLPEETNRYRGDVFILMREDEASLESLGCPMHVAKSVSQHARLGSILVRGGSRIRAQEDSLNNSIGMVVGTRGRILQHSEEGNMVYGDIAYLVLYEADTMFDRGFGPDIRKFLAPLKHCALKTND
ncbi:unnamed protein product [Eruca vesicaria subsp. sativa]|uniref:DEAD/DEAH-box helicase domain-containing protein n=1 Tax=Eruca vesicaria subsp. sativa TaxID=29727 RepID=A0ABC8LND0_ERUVS|nr:unnamed protein product [Eruca vesicaria subsp. sativa]